MVGIGSCSLRGCNNSTNKRFCREHRYKEDRERFIRERREAKISYKVKKVLSWLNSKL